MFAIALRDVGGEGHLDAGQQLAQLIDGELLRAGLGGDVDVRGERFLETLAGGDAEREGEGGGKSENGATLHVGVWGRRDGGIRI